MEIDKLFNGSVDSIPDDLFGSINNSVSEVREMQKKKVAENVQLVIQALKKIESDLREQFGSVSGSLEKRILSIKDGKDGINGRDGKPGRDGKDGKDGKDGRPGRDGLPGRPGADGRDGVGVLGARIDFDGALVITLTNGQEINVGEVVAPELAESIKVITNGGGTSQGVLDTLASLQAQISAIASLGAVSYQGTWNASTNTPTITSGSGTKGYYYVVSVAGTTSIDSEAKWGVGDWIVFNGTSWQKVDGGDTGDFTNLNVSGIANFSGQLASSVMFLNASNNLATDSSFSYDGVTQTLTSPKFNVSGGTANGVAYLNGSNVLTSGSALTFDGTNFAVGSASAIGGGVVSAQGDLAAVNGYVFKNSAANYGNTNNFIRLVNSSNATVGGITHTAVTSLGIWGNTETVFLLGSTGATEGMRLTSTGLGIGTSSPGYKLDVNGVGRFTTRAQSSAFYGNTTGITEFMDSLGTTGMYVTGAGASPANSIRFYSVGTNTATIDSSGNLGIGTSSPSYRLDVQGGTTVAQIRSTTTTAGAIPKLRFNHAGNDTFSIVGGSYMAWLSSDTTERMRLDSSGNLGIGTSSPGYKLDVRGANRILNVAALTGTNGAYQTFVNTAGTFFVGLDSSNASEFGGVAYSANFYHSGNYPMLFWTNGLRQMTLDSSGNLGLGVTPSAWGSALKALQFAGKWGAIAANTSNGNFELVGNCFLNSSGNWIYEGSFSAARYTINNAAGGSHVWYTSPSGTAGNAISFTQAMTLDASSNLMIGTTSAAQRLTVFKNISSNNSADAGIAIVRSGSTYGSNLYHTYSTTTSTEAFGLTVNDNTTLTDAQYTKYLVGSNGVHIWYGATTASERARIDSSGNLLVGQTALVNSERLGVTKNGNVFLVKNTQNTGTARLVYQNGAGTIDYFYNYASSSEIGTITNTTTSVAYNTTSDYRLKDNQAPLTGSGEFIDALQPKTWNWKQDGSKGVGFIAHEVQAVSPNSVVGEKDAVDEDGKPKYQAMEYGSAEFIANIIAELQSLRKRVAQLEGK